jgi:acylphosphatase
MADSLGLKGWVRNLPDGSVEAIFEGSPAAVDEAVEWCRKGPSYSMVKNLVKKEEPYKGEFESFRIVF